MNTLPTAADVILAQAQAAQANAAASASNSSKAKSIHWVNIYPLDDSTKIGGFPIDHKPKIVEACLSDPKFAQAYFGGLTANPFVRYEYQQAGVSRKPEQTIDVASVMAQFKG